MTPEGIRDVYPDCAFYINISNFDKVDVHFPKHQKVAEVADAPVEIFHIKKELYSYPSGTQANNSDSLKHAVH